MNSQKGIRPKVVLMDLDCNHCQNQVHAYVRGRLSQADTDRIEAHILHCADCRSEFQAERRLTRAMKGLAAREAAGTKVHQGVLSWLVPQNQFRQAGLMAAAVFIALVIPLSMLFLESKKLRQQLSESQGREHKLAQDFDKQQARLEDLSQKAAQAQVVIKNAHPVRISIVRNGTKIIEIEKDATHIPLEIIQSPDYDDYRFVMENGEGVEVFREDGLYPDKPDFLRIILPVNKIMPGSHVIKIQATQDGEEMGSPRLFPVEFRIN